MENRSLKKTCKSAKNCQNNKNVEFADSYWISKDFIGFHTRSKFIKVAPYGQTKLVPPS